MSNAVLRARVWALLGLLAFSPLAAAQTMEIVTGQGRYVDVPGTTVGVSPGAIAAAPDGYLYVSDINGRLMRLNMADDTVTALPTTPGVLRHNLGYTYGLAVDFAGAPHVYSQGALHRIAADGTLTNVGASWSGPMAFAPDGNVYIVPGDNRVYRRDPSGTVEPFAGGEEPGFGGDGGPALSALLSSPQGIAVAANGDIYVSDSGNNRIRVISAVNGSITTFAGNGVNSNPTNGVHALQTSIAYPRGLDFDAAGNLYIGSGRRILRIDAVSRLVTIVGGNGSTSVSGDGGPALAAGISWPRYVAVNANGDVFFSDDRASFGHIIRKITASTGIVDTVIGYPHSIYCGEENGPAHEACLTQPVGLAIDRFGWLYIADVSIQRIRRVIVDGIPNAWISTYRQMAEAPIGIEFDSAGNLYTASFGGYQVNRIDGSNGVITRIAGGNGYGFGGDGGPATAARLAAPTDVALDASGNIYIADGGNNRIRRVEADTGIISTYANQFASSIEFDPAGNLVLGGNCTLRRIDAITRAVTVIAGTGTCWGSDIPGGTPATATNIGNTSAFAFDPAGNIYVGWYEQIYRIDASTGIISRIQVPGGVLTTPEGVRLRRPGRMETDQAGHLYVSQDGFPNIYVFKISGLVDSTPPLITPYVVGTAGTGDWYRSNVNVYFNYTDYESSPSAVSGTCAGGWVTEDTAGVTYTCTVTSLGGTATETVTVRRDTVAPTLNFGAASPAPDSAGWNSTDVSLPFTANDALSGVYSTSGANPVVITGEGAGLTAPVVVTDLAGNSASFTSPAFNIDRSPPTVTANAQGTPGADGWYRSDVQITWTVNDDGSPVHSRTGCDETTVSSDTTGVTFTCTAASGGGTTSASIMEKRDATAPTLTFGAPNPPPNGAGVNSTDVSIPFTTADATSGVASTSRPSPVVITGEGTGLTAQVVVTDAAGNSASFTSPAVNISYGPPVVEPVVTGTLGLNGWYTSDVQVAWSISTPPASILSSTGCATSAVTTDTASVTFTCSVTSAGGTTSNSINLKRDATPPVLIFGTPTPAPNANGWINNKVNVLFTRSDAMSGVNTTSSNSPLVITTDGAGVTGQVVVTDRAGNVGTFTTVPLNIDRTPPVVSLLSPANSAVYGLYQNNVVSSFSCTDVSLASCVGTTVSGTPVDTTTSGERSFRVTATDLVNLTTQVTHWYRVASTFNFQGFLAPMNAAPILNQVAPGTVVPIRFRLPDGHGGFVTNTAAFTSATVSSLTCGSATVVPLNDTASGPPGISFDAGTNTFTYHWATDAGWTGCRKLTLRLRDNSQRELRFRFQ